MCKKKEISSHTRRDSNPQPPDSKSGALSIAPRALDATDGGPADAVARFGPLHKGGRIGGRHLTAQIAREKKFFVFEKKKKNEFSGTDRVQHVTDGLIITVDLSRCIR